MPSAAFARAVAVIVLVAGLFLLIWGFAETTATASSSTQPLVVNVTGQQWVWTFSYPHEGNIESDQLYLPVDQPVIFHVTSEDVVHSFWVVQMGIKEGLFNETSYEV